MSYCYQSRQEFIWKGIRYMVIHTKKNIVLIQTVFDSEQENSIGERKNVKVEELNEAWRTGELQFVVAKRLASPNPDNVIGIENKYPNWEDIDESICKEAEWRLTVILPLLDVPKRTHQMVNNRVEEKREEAKNNGYSLSRSNIYRWMAWYRDSRDVRSLADNTE